MPIEKDEFKTGKTRDKVEDDIVLFLKDRQDKAYTSQEIMGGIEHPATDFTNPDIAQMSAFAISDFSALLSEMVNKGRLSMRAIKGQMHFSAPVPDAIKCPKCHTEITAAPKKTWIMTSPKPDKLGNRHQLNLGLFECPTHGNFRVTLNKQKLAV